MLSQLRSFSRSWAAYLLLFVLVIAFAIWGVNDVFSGAGSRNLAKVYGRNITPAQLSRELELELRGRRNQGETITQQEAIAAGRHEQLLNSLIARTAFYAYAEKLGVSASDVEVAKRIREIPAVQNPITGGFDQAAYDAFLNQLRYSRGEFEEDLRGDITTNMLMQSLAAGVRPPSSFGALLLTYTAETRVISIAEIPAAAAGAIPRPTEPQLQAFYEESQAQLRLPEFRGLTLVVARVQDFVPRVEVTEAQLQEEFEARRAALTQPERRTYVRISAQTEAQANDAAARLSRGESPDAVAQALGLQVVRGENQTQAEVPDTAVAEAVFTTAPRSGPRVVRASLSPFAVVRVESATPAVEPDLAALRDELRQAIAMDEASDLLNSAISAFEDARAGGASMAEAARQQGLAVITIPAVEEGGRNPEGAPVEQLAGLEEVLEVAFQTPEGEASDFMPVGDSDVIVAVDRVIPESVRPLDEVREELTQAWMARERARRLREIADEVVGAVRGDQALAAAARAHGGQIVVSSREVNRAAASQIPARGLGAQIFAAREGEVMRDMRVDGNAMLVAVVEQINRPDPAAAPEAVEANRAQFMNPQSQISLINGFVEAIQSEVVDRGRPERNEQLLNQLFPRPGADSEDGQ